jgi:hypothetical protein
VTPDMVNALLDLGAPGLLLVGVIVLWRRLREVEADRDRIVELRYQDAIETREIARALIRKAE